MNEMQWMRLNRFSIRIDMDVLCLRVCVCFCFCWTTTHMFTSRHKANKNSLMCNEQHIVSSSSSFSYHHITLPQEFPTIYSKLFKYCGIELSTFLRIECKTWQVLPMNVLLKFSMNWQLLWHYWIYLFNFFLFFTIIEKPEFHIDSSDSLHLIPFFVCVLFDFILIFT